MPRICLLLLLLLSSRLSGEEIVSYFVGKGNPEGWLEEIFTYWGNSDSQQNASDSFVRFPWGRTPDFQTLKEPSFESRFFEEGDLLKDLSPLVNPKADVEMVFNETSGRIVLRAPSKIQMEFGMMYRDFEPPKVIEGRFVLLEVPVEEDSKFIWQSDLIPGRGSVIHEVVLLSRNERKVYLRNPGAGIGISWEASFEDTFRELNSKVNASFKWNDEMLELETEIVSLAGVPRLLASTSDGKKSLQLWFHPRVFLAGGVLVDDAVEGEEKGEPMLEVRRSAYRMHQQGAVADGNGKQFRAILTLPRAFLFQSNGELNLGDADPFATDDGEPISKDLPFLTEIDDRIPVRPGMIAIDVREEFEGQGVNFQEGDYAVWVPSWDTVYCRLSTKEMELIDALFVGPNIGGRTVVETGIRYGESQSFRELFLAAENGNRLARMKLSNPRGEVEWSVKALGGIDKSIMDIELEARIGKTHAKSSLALKEGQPTAIPNTDVQGEEQSLSVESRLRRLGSSPSKE